MRSKCLHIVFFACAAALCAEALARVKPASQKALNIAHSGSVEIVFASPPSAEETLAARILAEEIGKIKKLRAQSENKFSNTPRRARIIMRNTRRLDADIPFSELLRRNEFAVETGKFSIVLEYPAAHKAGWIVGKFLRDFCGAQYFSPAECGAEYSKGKLFFKTGRFEFEPPFFGAFFSDYPQSLRWRVLNGIDTSSPFFAFSHNLNKIFSKELFKTSPHLFGMRAGARGRLSRSPSGQPDLLSYQAQTYAAAAAVEALKNKKMFSIGIADTQQMDERPEYAKYKDGYFRGYPNWSAAVFEFSNEVARRVGAENKNGALGMLAYMICEKPPEFSLEKNLLPFYTADRANNFLPECEAEDFRAMETWGKRGGASFGIYEYLYGAPYLFARDISAASARAITKAFECGARFYYAETYSLWGYDAKKMWCTARMLENPRADFSRLEDEFFNSCYKSAAAHMREFFRIAASAWNPRKIPPRWLALYRAENALELLGAAPLGAMKLALSRAEAAASADTDKNVLPRVKETAAMFALTEAAYNFHASKLEMSDLLQSGADAEKCAAALKKYSELKSRFLEAQKKAAEIQHFESSWLALYNEERFAPLDKLAKKLRGAGLASEAARAGLSAPLRAFEMLDKRASFKFSVSKWENFRSVFSTMSRDFENASMRVENGALAFRNCELSGIAKSFPIAENQAAEFSGTVSNNSSPGTICYASLLFLDSRGGELKRKTLIFNSRPETDFVLADTAPENCAKVNISVFAARQKKGDVFAVKKLALKKS